MAYLYQSSALFRALVSASRDPRVMAAIVVSVTGGCWLAGRSAQGVTSSWSEELEDELKKKMSEDKEALRNSQIGKAALAQLFESVGKGKEENRQYLNKEIKVPPIEWHPAATSGKQKNSSSDAPERKKTET